MQLRLESRRRPGRHKRNALHCVTGKETRVVTRNSAEMRETQTKYFLKLGCAIDVMDGKKNNEAKRFTSRYAKEMGVLHKAQNMGVLSGV